MGTRHERDRPRQYLESKETSHEEDKVTATSIWCQLLLDGEFIGSATELEFKKSVVTMDRIKKSIKEQFSARLTEIVAAELEVYKYDEYDNTSKRLKAGATWNLKSHGGDTEETAMVVKATKPATVYNPGKFVVSSRVIHNEP